MFGLTTRLGQGLTALGIILFSNLAWAEAPEATTAAPKGAARDPAAAEALFRAGRQLLQEGKLEEAFAKFEESYRLDPTAGALLNMGECRFREGKSASAWALYQQAATLADVQGKPDLYELASHRQQELEPHLSYLTFHVSKAVPGLEVKRDGVLVGAAQFDVTLPVDPGRHFISAQAAGYESIQFAVVVQEKHDRQIINVPALKELRISQVASVAPQPKPMSMPARNQSQAQSPTSPWPWALGGVGAASLVVGTVSIILAIHDNNYANDNCRKHTDCNNDVLQAQGRRTTEAGLAEVTIPVGIIALGSAATWLLFSPRAAKGEQSPPVAFGTFTNGRDATCWMKGTF